jgi:AcrR family transcriptional regulator
MERPERAAGKGDRRREEILAVARTLLVHDGYDRFVLRTIAERVSMTLGNLQYYYASRDELLAALVRAEFARNQREVATIATGAGAPRVRLAAIARHLIEVWAHDGGRVYAVMSFLALHQSTFRALHREIYTAFYAGLVPVLREIRPRASRATLLARARLITTVIDGVLVQIPGRTFVADAIAAVVRLAEL